MKNFEAEVPLPRIHCEPVIVGGACKLKGAARVKTIVKHSSIAAGMQKDRVGATAGTLLLLFMAFQGKKKLLCMDPDLESDSRPGE